jgi:hypothetical protein
MAADLRQAVVDAAAAWVDDPDLAGTCPYLARYESFANHDPDAVCGFSCHDEPECITGAPRGGWKSTHLILAVKALRDAAVEP